MHLVFGSLYFSIVPILIFLSTTNAIVDYNFPIKCEGFVDKRGHPEVDDLNMTTLTLPPDLTNGNTGSLSFQESNPKTLEERCGHPVEEIDILFSINNERDKMRNSKYFFQNHSEFENYTFFTSDGYLHRLGHYWHYTDYCIQSLSDQKLTVKHCKLNCSADLSKSYLYTRFTSYNPSRVCVPKCCGVDEILSLSDSTCRRLNNTEPNYFFPYLHLRDPIWFPQKQNNRSSSQNLEDSLKILVRPQLSLDRQSWTIRGIPAFHTGVDTIWNYLHFFRNDMRCKHYAWRQILYNEVSSESQNDSKLTRQNFRVEVHPGQVKLAFLTKSRKWAEYSQKFCVDGMDGWGDGLSKEPVNQVVVVCVSKEASHAKMDQSIKIGLDTSSSSNNAKYSYLIVMLLCVLLLLMGYIPYGASWQKLNLHGKVIASFLGTMTMSYAVTFVGLCVALSENAKYGDNSIEIVSTEFPWYRRIGWFCAIMGVLDHFFYCSRLFWMVVLHNPLKMFSKEYVSCALFGWASPAFLILAFCLIDWLNNDPWSEAVVPDYGVEFCNVASWSAGYYVFIPTAILLVVCFFFICASSLSLKNTKSGAEQATVKMLAAISCVVAFTWLILLQEWIRTFLGQPENWARSMLLSFGALFETVLLIIIFCMNEVVLEMWSENCSWSQGVIALLKRTMFISKGSGWLGSIISQDDEHDKEYENNDTVVIENNELMDKNGSRVTMDA